MNWNRSIELRTRPVEVLLLVAFYGFVVWMRYRPGHHYFYGYFVVLALFTCIAMSPFGGRNRTGSPSRINNKFYYSGVVWVIVPILFVNMANSLMSSHTFRVTSHGRGRLFEDFVFSIYELFGYQAAALFLILFSLFFMSAGWWGMQHSKAMGPETPHDTPV